MALSRKYYQGIADVLCNTGASKSVVAGMANYFQSDNPRFQAVRFERAVESCKRGGLSGSRRRRRRRRRVRF